MNGFDAEHPPGTIALPIEHKDLGLGGGDRNPLLTYRRTQAQFSPLLNAAIAAVDRLAGTGAHAGRVGS